MQHLSCSHIQHLMPCASLQLLCCSSLFLWILSPCSTTGPWSPSSSPLTESSSSSAGPPKCHFIIINLIIYIYLFFKYSVFLINPKNRIYSLFCAFAQLFLFCINLFLFLHFVFPTAETFFPILDWLQEPHFFLFGSAPATFSIWISLGSWTWIVLCCCCCCWFPPTSFILVRVLLGTCAPPVNPKPKRPTWERQHQRVRWEFRETVRSIRWDVL